MKWVGLTLIAAVWGPVSAIIFYKAWLSFLGILACLIGLYRGRVSRGMVAGHLFSYFTRAVFYGLGVLAGFLILFQVLPFGRTQGEVITYWLSAMAAEAVLLSRLSRQIEEIWRQVNGPDEEN